MFSNGILHMNTPVKKSFICSLRSLNEELQRTMADRDREQEGVE